MASSATTLSLVKEIKILGESLTKEGLSDAPSSSQCAEIVATLTTLLSSSSDNHHSSIINISILEQTLIGKTLTKTIKSFKRHHRTSLSSSSSSTSEWETCIAQAAALLTSLKQIVSNEHANQKAKKVLSFKKELKESGLPKSISVYKNRLETQKKEMYKNPPALPPPSITVEETHVLEPKRHATTRELTFVCGNGATTGTASTSISTSNSIQPLLIDFKPNRTPEEILRAGAFGGTYYRSIVSAVTNVKYKTSEVLQSSVKPAWIQGLDEGTYLTNNTYVPKINKFKVKCGGSLGMWESSGWIADCDPYGWFQWYCRFYQGRRCSDDERQISRWLKSAGPKGRFRSQLCNKIFAAGGMGHVGDVKVSPVIRQTLLHWGLEITEHVLRKHGKRVGKL